MCRRIIAFVFAEDVLELVLEDDDVVVVVVCGA
jgi:hypothetical protein